MLLEQHFCIEYRRSRVSKRDERTAVNTHIHATPSNRDNPQHPTAMSRYDPQHALSSDFVSSMWVNIQASQLNYFYNIAAKETTAAIVIQSQRGRVLAIKCAQLLALQAKSEILIQSLVRGLFARCLLIREKCVRVYIALWSRKRQVILRTDCTK